MAEDYRLPTAVAPTHYELAIRTDFDATPPSYSGEVLISLDVKDDTSKLVFNIDASLNVTDVLLGASEDAAVTEVPISALSVHKELQRGQLDLMQSSLRAGTKAKLLLRWEAPIGTNMAGYYVSEGDVDSKTGKRPIYALTQFEPTAARRAFPCWDEPSFKAKYEISMIARKQYTALSNMPATSSTPWKPSSKLDAVFSYSYKVGSSLGRGDDLVVTRFEETPLVSTYLVAFACGEFAYLDSEHHSKLTEKTVPVRTYVTPNQVEKVRFATDVMKWALPIYEELFDVAYPLPKLDTLVAHDFDMGAMENWGLITGRTTAYLIDQKSSVSALKRVGSVQCHEIAHMWFGNIVTMKWWDNLWLNEAFATLMGSIVLPDRIWPEWKMGTSFINDHWVRALNLDSRRTSHPIEVDCPDSSKINQIFDAISYSKGASVLRMLKSVVGEDKFFKGVSIYLKKHLYGNAQTSDLWAGLSESVGKDIGQIMNNWILKVGYPVITVEELGNGQVKVTQNRFLSTGDVKKEEDETIWWIPLMIKTIEDGKVLVDQDAVLSERSAAVKIPADTFKLNTDTVGLYRVAYSPERLAKLGKQASLFSTEDRIGLISDSAALASAGYAKTSSALTLVAELSNTETEYLPYARIADVLASVAGIFWEDEKIRDGINKVRVQVFHPVVEKLGYDQNEGDSPDVKELRSLAVSAAAGAEDSEVIKELQSRFAPFLNNSDDSRIAPDVQRSVFTMAVKHGGAAEYEKMLAVYNDPPNPSTQVDAMFALCAAKDPALIERTFAMVADANAIKDQNLYIFFQGLGGNRVTRRRAADYLMDNWVALNERYSASHGLRNCIPGALSGLSSKTDLEKVEAWASAHDVTKYNAIVDQTIEGIEAQSNWLARAAEDVKSWLAQQ